MADSVVEIVGGTEGVADAVIEVVAGTVGGDIVLAAAAAVVVVAVILMGVIALAMATKSGCGVGDKVDKVIDSLAGSNLRCGWDQNGCQCNGLIMVEGDCV